MKFRLALTASLLALAAAALLLSSCACREKPLSLLLITVDTLRPDDLGYAGCELPTSPNLDRLAAEGTVYTNARSVSGWTLPSVATILCGRDPQVHGATDFHWAMADSLPTLASVLRDRGYDTRGFVSHVILKPDHGLAKGFDDYDWSVLNIGNPHDVATGEALADRALAGLDDAKRPFFLWVHFFDPHFAYLAHPRWYAFGDSAHGRYDQEVAYTDAQIGRLLDALREKGLDDRTLVAFTADHGEEFGEHGGEFHYTLHDEVLRVPLIIRAPGAAHRIDDSPVAQRDLMPSLLSLLGIDPGPDVVLPGRDLSRTAAAAGPLFFDRDRPPPWRQRAVFDGRWKLVEIVERDLAQVPTASRGTESPVENVAPGIHLYDLQNDPGELHDLYSPGDPHAQELRRLLADHFAGGERHDAPVAVDAKLRRQLESLGYVH